MKWICNGTFSWSQKFRKQHGKHGRKKGTGWNANIAKKGTIWPRCNVPSLPTQYNEIVKISVKVLKSQKDVKIHNHTITVLPYKFADNISNPSYPADANNASFSYWYCVLVIPGIPSTNNLALSVIFHILIPMDCVALPLFSWVIDLKDNLSH